jgi:hypothetical protein
MRATSRTITIIILIIVLATTGIVVFLSSSTSQRPSSITTTRNTKIRMTGSLFVSDAGRAKGGFEYTATYNATLVASNGSGTLNLTLSIGLGDSLTQHVYTVSNLSINSSRVSMLLNGRPVRLDWTANDTVWNGRFSNNFIASWGPNSPQSELRGIIAPTIFPGLYEGYSVELRLAPVQP